MLKPAMRFEERPGRTKEADTGFGGKRNAHHPLMRDQAPFVAVNLTGRFWPNARTPKPDAAPGQHRSTVIDERKKPAR